MLEGLTKAAMIELISREFSDVSRKGGVSWSEAWIIDKYGSMEEMLAARSSDTDQTWLEVAQREEWRTWEHCPWSFLDKIGFRYYLVAAVMRFLLTGEDCLESSFFTFKFYNSNYDSFTRGQLVALGEYLRYRAELPRREALMMVLDEADMSWEDYVASGETWTPEAWSDWQEPLEIWQKFLASS